MRVRDLFLGHRLALEPEGERWLVSLLGPNGDSDVIRAGATSAAALSVVESWMTILNDQRDISGLDPSSLLEAGDPLAEWLQRHQTSEPVSEDETADEAAERERLRRWFEREMG